MAFARCCVANECVTSSVKQIYADNALRADEKEKAWQKVSSEGSDIVGHSSFVLELTVMASVGFRVNVFALNGVDGNFFLTVHFSLPTASTCVELTLPARPLRLVFQEETQRPGGAADCRLEIRGDRAAHFTANSDSEGAPAGREEPFAASPLPNASMPNAIVGGSTAPSVVPRTLRRLWKPWWPSLPLCVVGSWRCS